MDPASLAAAFVAAQAGQLQTAVAAKIMRMNAQASSDTVKLLESARQNFNQLANVANGIGGNLDITA